MMVEGGNDEAQSFESPENSDSSASENSDSAISNAAADSTETQNVQEQTSVASEVSTAASDAVSSADSAAIEADTSGLTTEVQEEKAFQRTESTTTEAETTTTEPTTSSTKTTISPNDLGQIAKDTQANAPNPKMGKAGAATNVLDENGQPLTALHATRNGGAEPVEGDDWTWTPETSEKGGTCGGSMMCWKIAQNAASGTASFPKGAAVDIVEQQEDGLAACEECQANANALAKALGRIVRLYTLNELGNLRRPFIYYPKW